jgi:uncharacterized protein (DUF433 family)
VDWRVHIHSDPDIRGGRPIIKGTRLAADFLLDLLANGWTVEQVIESYPNLKMEHLQAVFAFAAECLHQEIIYDVASP